MALRAVIFVGPSLPAERRPSLEGVEERPPIRRGDLPALPPVSIVGIVDGEFGQSRAVSPREVITLMHQGVKVLGASSMGALRAAELSAAGMEGIGKIYEMYRREVIASDDEVAIHFDPDTQKALSEPLVNVRCSVERLRQVGVLDDTTAQAIIDSAAELPFPDRVYRRILLRAGERVGRDFSALAQPLAEHDQKRLDALALYQRLAQLLTPSH